MTGADPTGGLDPAGGSEPVVVDARALRCPLPVIELAKAARRAAAGTTLMVLATDPAARYDVPAWARLRGHTLVSVESSPDGPDLAITIRTGPPPESPRAQNAAHAAQRPSGDVG